MIEESNDDSIATLLYQHRLEIAFAIVLSHLMGWTSTITDNVGGIC